MRHRRLILLAGMLGMVAGLGFGCATKTVAPPASEPAPIANTPANAVKRLAWAINNRDPESIRDLITDDFQLFAAGVDSAGNPPPDPPPNPPPYDRDWLLKAVAALEDSSSAVYLLLDHNLVPFPDSRPGRDPRWHKQIRTSVDLKVRIDSGNTVEVSGTTLFFLTRGDSAAIPLELESRGFKSDSLSWWIDRVEDETLGSAGPPAATEPSKALTLAALLEYFYSLVAP